MIFINNSQALLFPLLVLLWTCSTECKARSLADSKSLVGDINTDTRTAAVQKKNIFYSIGWGGGTAGASNGRGRSKSLPHHVDRLTSGRSRAGSYVDDNMLDSEDLGAGTSGAKPLFQRQRNPLTSGIKSTRTKADKCLGTIYIDPKNPASVLDFLELLQLCHDMKLV